MSIDKNNNTKEDQRVYSDGEFWKGVWDVDQISGFHKLENHPMLMRHLSKLTQHEPGVKIFFPFCGKEIDMAWLASLGHEVVGVEYCEKPVQDFFREQNIKYEVKDVKNFKLYISEDKRIRIYKGDFFDFTTEYESHIENVWDRGAYISIPADQRVKYAQHIQSLLAPNFRYLFDIIYFKPELYAGPPHPVNIEEIKHTYGEKCHIELIDTAIYKAFNDKLELDRPIENVCFLTNKKLHQ